jgi:glycosyltransferase involved in cell wall biosynthesis
MQYIQISLVIATYNRAALLADALHSVAASRCANHGAIEVIVIDNNSTDSTRQTVEDIHSRGFPFKLRYVLETRQGISYARNRGIDESRGGYLAFMDDDQIIDKDYLSRLEPAFVSTGADCIGGPLKYYNNKALPNWLPTLLEGVGQYDIGNKIKIMRPGDGIFRGGNMCFRRAALLDIGQYDVSLGRKGDSLEGGEENDMQQRLRAAHMKMVYHPDLIQYHYLRPERLTKRYWRKHKFDYGRSSFRLFQLQREDHTGTPFLGAPRWLWWFLLTREVPKAVWALVRFDRAEAFQKRLDLWFRWGQIQEARTLSRMKRSTNS